MLRLYVQYAIPASTVSACVRIRVRKRTAVRVHGLPTRVRRHFAAIPCSLVASDDMAAQPANSLFSVLLASDWSLLSAHQSEAAVSSSAAPVRASQNC